MSGQMKRADAILAELEQRDLMELVTRHAKAHHVLLSEVISRGRCRPMVRARHAIWAELHDSGLWSYPRIAALFGRDHTTVLYGVHDERERRAKVVAA